MQSLNEEFRLRLAAVEARLRAIPEQQWSEPYGPHSWLRKQVLGHLVDSAINNHLRFVMAALDGRYEGPGYDSDAWVRIHDYSKMPYQTIVEYWRSRNAQLRDVVANLSQEQLLAPCRVGDEPVVSLREIITSYLAHMEHHVDQIAPTAPKA